MTLTRRVVDDSVYLLLDDIALRLCAAWPLIPASIRSEGLHDTASYLARFCNCTVNEAMTRVELMLAAGVMKPGGRVDEKVRARLQRAGALRMGLEDEEPEPDKPVDREDEDED